MQNVFERNDITALVINRNPTTGIFTVGDCHGPYIGRCFK